MSKKKYQPRVTDSAVDVERLRAERLESVELSDDGYSWYASGNDSLTTWSGQAAPDWAAGARTLHAMAGWAYGLGLRYEGDPAKVRQWTGTPPNFANGSDQRRTLGGLYAKYANCRRWWSSWQAEHADGTPKDSMVLLDTKSCHDPLCPLCMRLRAHKREIAYGRAWEDLQAKKKSRDGAEYRLLQIVIDSGRNCQGDELKDQLDKLIKGTQRFIRWLDETKGVVAHVPAAWVWGTETKRSDSPLWMLGTEITRHNAPDALQGTYHPHVHLIVAVYSSHIRAKIQGGKWTTSWRPSAGITRSEMLDKWRDIMGDQYIKNLYMGKVDSPHQALKYAVKGSIGKVDDKTGDAALYVKGDDYDSYNMDTLSTIHDAIVEYREDGRNHSRQMFRASLAWAHLATLKAQELKIALEDTDADNTVQQTGQGRIVRGRQRKGRLEAVSIDASLTTLEEARAQIRLEQSLRHMKRG